MFFEEPLLDGFKKGKSNKCINELYTFFSPNNEEEVKKFLIYMRNRDLTQEKNKWSPV